MNPLRSSASPRPVGSSGSAHPGRSSSIGGAHSANTSKLFSSQLFPLTQKPPPTGQRLPPRATTVEEDIEEEIQEERMYALDRAMDTLTTDVTELISDPRRMQKNLPLKDIKREETRRLREYQLQTISKQQGKARRKFDLVEDMFQKAIERRYRAHLKIAADPPADRLVGKSMMQYVPAAMLHQQEQQTELFLQVQHEPLGEKPNVMVQGRMAPHLTHPVPLLAGAEDPLGRGTGAVALPTIRSHSDDRSAEEKDTIVFLTEMDGPDATPSSARSNTAQENDGNVVSSSQVVKPSNASAPVSRTPSHAELNKHLDETMQLESLLSPQERRRKKQADLSALYDVPEDRIAEWRELGYDVVYVGSRDPVRACRSAKRRGDADARKTTPAETVSEAEAVVEPSRAYISSRERDRRSRATWSECGWMKLAPLPPVCLVQRRLAVEDMKLEELLAESRRYQRFQTTVGNNNKKSSQQRGTLWTHSNASSNSREEKKQSNSHASTNSSNMQNT